MGDREIDVGIGKDREEVLHSLAIVLKWLFYLTELVSTEAGCPVNTSKFTI